jgi:hypothetical protein
MFTIVIPTKFHTPKWIGSLVVLLKQNDKCRFRAELMPLFYILQKVTLTKFIFFEDIKSITSSGDSVLHTPQIYTVAM